MRSLIMQVQRVVRVEFGETSLLCSGIINIWKTISWRFLLILDVLPVRKWTHYHWVSLEEHMDWKTLFQENFGKPRYSILRSILISWNHFEYELHFLFLVPSGQALSSNRSKKHWEILVDLNVCIIAGSLVISEDHSTRYSAFNLFLRTSLCLKVSLV